MKAAEFLTWQTLMIMGLGLGASSLIRSGRVSLRQLISLRKKINPMVGAAGISAFPMSARVVQKMGLEADPETIS